MTIQNKDLAALSVVLGIMGPLAAQAEQNNAVELKTITVTAQDRGAFGPTQGYTVPSSAGATKTDTDILEIPQAVSIVTRQQIDEQSPRTVAEALRYTPGVFTGAAGSTTRYDYIVLRGFSDHPTANTFLDGLKLVGDPDGYNTLQLDPYVIERLDVIRGPASVTYGQASPGGLVAMTTKRPQLDSFNEVAIVGGNKDQRSLMFDTTGSVGVRSDMAYRFIGKVAAAEQQQQGAESERYVLAPSFNWNITDRTSLLLQAYLQNEPHTGYHGALPYEGTVVDHNGRRISRSFNESSPGDEMTRYQRFLGYQFTHAFNDRWSFQQKYRYQRSKTDLTQFSQYGWAADDSDSVLRSFARSEEASSAHILDNALTGQVVTGSVVHTLLAGVDYQTSENDGYNSYQYLPTTLSTINPVYDDSAAFVLPTHFERQRKQTGLYLQDQLRVGKWSFTAGLRHDSADVSNLNPETGVKNEWSGSKWTTRLGAVYLADNGLAPYVSYSEGFDPSMAYATDPSGNVLTPLESRQIEVGIRYRPPGSAAQVSAAVYKLTQENVAQYNPNTFTYDPLGEVESRGIELEAQVQITPALTALAGYTYTDMEVTEGALKGNTPYLAPAHKATAWLNYAFANGVGLGGGLRYTSSMWADSENTAKIPSVTTADLSLRYDLGRANSALKGAKVQLNVNNLFDKKYVASCYSLFACYYGEERNISATLSYRW